jgi:DNA-binding transcriptional LysR family regulator
MHSCGGGFLPEYLARPHIAAGRLVEKHLQRPARLIALSYAWRKPTQGDEGRALQWWLAQLENPVTRKALLARQQPI